jgi:tetratricopeptide (TPR) repeat protein
VKNQQRSPSHAWRVRLFLASFAICLHFDCFKTVYAQPEPVQQDLSEALIPKTSAMFSNRGYVRSRVGDVKGAVEDFDKAIEMDEKNVEAFSGRGYLRLYDGDQSEAMADFNRALAISPHDTSALCGRGQANANMGNEKEALADFNLAIKLDPSNAPSYIFRGYHLERHGDQPRAIADFDQTIKLDPTNALAYCYRGTARQAVKDNQGAVSDFSKVIKFDPRYAWAYYRRGQARDQLRDHSGAISDFNQYIKLKPTDPWGYRARGFTHQEIGALKAAIRDYTKSIELEKTDPWTFSARGFLRGKIGDTKGSIADYKQAAQLERKTVSSSAKKTTIKNKSDTTHKATTSATTSATTANESNTSNTSTNASNTSNAANTSNTSHPSNASNTSNASNSSDASNTSHPSNASNASNASNDLTSAGTQPTISLITNPAVYSFSAKTLAEAQQKFGPPISKIKQILIFHRPGPNCQTMMWDADKGIFCIFMANKNFDAYFKGNLGHELLHLLNAKLCDPYVEGLCSVFGEEALDNESDGSLYQALLESTPFYRETYQLMKSLKASVSPESYSSILRFAKFDRAKQWMHIDINEWLASIPSAEQNIARKLIEQSAGGVQAKMPRDDMYVFVRPKQQSGSFQP